jgi:hypothetical protein
MATSPATLEGIPPELRNRIYAYLFESNDPILLVPSNTLAPYKPSLAHPIPGINILGVCRQIKTEAEGVLYSANTFVASPVPGSQLDALESGHLRQWLTRIGSFRRLLRNIRIEMIYHWVRTTINITDLVREMWQSGNEHINMSYSIGDQQLRQNQTVSSITALRQPTLDHDTITTITSLLSPKSHSNLGVYFRSRSTHLDIWIGLHSYNLFCYIGTDNYANYSDMRISVYNLHNHATLVKWQPPKEDYRLASVMGVRAIRNNIMSTLDAWESTSIVSGIDNETTCAAFPVCLAINRQLRSYALARLSLHSAPTCCTVNATHDTIEDFTALASWVECTTSYPSTIDPTVKLVFKSPLSEHQRVHINGTACLSALAGLGCDTTVQCFAALWNSSTPTTSFASCSLYRMRIQQLIVLSDLVEEHPTQCLRIGLVVWWNSQLQVSEAEFLEEGTEGMLLVCKDYSNWSEERLEIKKDECLYKLLEADEGPGFFCNLSTNSLLGQALDVAKQLYY